MAEAGYDAFISYAHAVDGGIAPLLRQGLQDFARPWYRRRAARVFLDQSSMAVNPALWPTILQSLERSRVLILLASPASAASPWVGREIEWWLEHRSERSLLIVLTAGEIIWDDAAGDFDWRATTALPEVLTGRCAAEPLHLDLRWARRGAGPTPREPRLQEAVAQLLAAIRGRDKDELIGEDLRRHRQTLRTAWGAAAVLACTTAAALVAAQLFVQQRDLARAREVEARRHLFTAQLKQAQIAAAAGDMVQVERLLAGQIPPPGEADLRGFPWYLLWRASHRELASLPAPLQSKLAFGADGHSLWAAGAEPREGSLAGRLLAYEVPGGRLLSERALRWPLVGLAEHGSGALLVAPAAGGEALRSGAGLLLLPPDGGEARSWPAQPGRYTALASSPDGSRLAAARLLPRPLPFSVVELWQPDEGPRSRRELSVEGWVRALAFSPDGAELALVADDAGRAERPARLQLIEPQTGAVRFERALPAQFALVLAWRPDGRRLIVGDERGAVLILEHEDGAVAARIDAHPGMVTAVALSPDGRLLASGGTDRVVRLWDLASAGLRAELPLMRAPIDALAVAPDGATLAVAGGLDLKLWSLAALLGRPSLDGARQSRPVAGPQLRDLAFSPRGGRVATLGEGGEVGVYDADGLRRELALKLDTDSLGGRALAWSPSGRLLAATGDGRLRIWSADDGAVRLDRALDGYDLFFADEARLFVASARGILLLDPADGGERRFSRLRAEVMTYSPALRLIAAARSSDGPRHSEVRLWDADRGRESCRLEGHQQGLLALAFSPDGSLLASGGYDGEVRLWQPSECRLLAALPPRRHAIQALRFAPDGRTLAISTEAAGASSGGTVVLIDPASGDEQLGLPTGTAWARAVDFSPDGLALAAGGDDQSLSQPAVLRVWRGARPAAAAHQR